MSKTDYKEMSRKELKQYVLTHKEDLEAVRELFSRPTPNAVYFGADMSIEEQGAKLKELLQKKH